MKQKPPRVSRDLDQIVRFLNSSPEAKEAKVLHVELRDDIDHLLKPPSIPQDAFLFSNASSAAQYWLSVVADKISGIDFIPNRDVWRWPDPLLKSYRNNVLRLGRERFVVTDTPLLEGDQRSYLYDALDRVLRSGEFSMLKRCQACPKYFVTGRANKQCCDRACNTNYQNQRRLESGYFTKNRRLKSRLKKKKKGREQ